MKSAWQKALFVLGELPLQDGATKLLFLDVQVPLKSVKSDKGVGKIDLVAIYSSIDGQMRCPTNGDPGV
jgi:hypothetical protein